MSLTSTPLSRPYPGLLAQVRGPFRVNYLEIGYRADMPRDVAIALILAADLIGGFVFLCLACRPRAREREEPILRWWWRWA